MNINTASRVRSHSLTTGKWNVQWNTLLPSNIFMVWIVCNIYTSCQVSRPIGESIWTPALPRQSRRLRIIIPLISSQQLSRSVQTSFSAGGEVLQCWDQMTMIRTWSISLTGVRRVLTCEMTNSQRRGQIGGLGMLISSQDHSNSSHLTAPHKYLLYYVNLFVLTLRVSEIKPECWRMPGRITVNPYLEHLDWDYWCKNQIKSRPDVSMYSPLDLQQSNKRDLTEFLALRC